MACRASKVEYNPIFARVTTACSLQYESNMRRLFDVVSSWADYLHGMRASWLHHANILLSSLRDWNFKTKRIGKFLSVLRLDYLANQSRARDKIERVVQRHLLSIFHRPTNERMNERQSLSNTSHVKKRANTKNYRRSRD